MLVGCLLHLDCSQCLPTILQLWHCALFIGGERKEVEIAKKEATVEHASFKIEI